jgi:hypothetical protein
VFFAKYNYNDHVTEYEMAGRVVSMGKKGNTYTILVGKPERK